MFNASGISGPLVVRFRGACSVRSGSPAASEEAGSKRACDPAASAVRGGSTEVCRGSKSGCPLCALVVSCTDGGARSTEVLIGVDPHTRRRTTRRPPSTGRRTAPAGYFHRQQAWPPGARGMGEALREAVLGRGRGERFGEVRGPVPPQCLVANGEDVVDVPAKLSARVRLLSTGEERKSDRLDAVYTAVAAWQSARACARSVGEEDLVAVLRMLTERRDDLLVKARTRAMRTTSTRGSRTSWCPARQAPLGLGPTERPPEAGAPDRRARRAYRRGRRGNLRLAHRGLRPRTDPGREDYRQGRRRAALPEQGPLLRLLHRHGAGRSLQSGELVRHRLSRAGDRQRSSS
jgi:hypothetical protein